MGIVNKTLWLWESWSRPHIELARAGILSTVMIKIKYNLILISCLINNSSCSCSGFRNLCECLSLSVFVNIDSLSWHRGRDRGDSLPSTDLMRKKEKTVLIIYRGHFTQITSDFCPPLLDRFWSWTKKGIMPCASGNAMLFWWHDIDGTEINDSVAQF